MKIYEYFFLVTLCHFCYIHIFLHTTHYRTWLDHIKQYVMRLRLADIYEWNQWIFLGFTSHK